MALLLGPYDELSAAIPLIGAGNIFEVPGQPQPWERAGTSFLGQRRRFFTKPKTRAYKHKVALCAKGIGLMPLEGPVFLFIRIWNGDRRIRDDDNMEKGIRDALNGIGWKDDSQVKGKFIVQGIDRENPRAIIGIYGFSQTEID